MQPFIQREWSDFNERVIGVWKSSCHAYFSVLLLASLRGLWRAVVRILSSAGVARPCGKVGSTQAKCLWKASSIWHVWRHCAITPQPSWLTSTGPPYISHAGQHNRPYPGQTKQGGTKYFHFWEHRYWVNRDKKVKFITFRHIVFLCNKDRSDINPNIKGNNRSQRECITHL